MLEHRSKLGEAQSLQQFSRDADEMEIWITEKLQMATEESYKDPANIQVWIPKYLNIFLQFLSAKPFPVSNKVDITYTWKHLLKDFLNFLEILKHSL